MDTPKNDSMDSKQPAYTKTPYNTPEFEPALADTASPSPPTLPPNNAVVHTRDLLEALEESLHDNAKSYQSNVISLFRQEHAFAQDRNRVAEGWQPLVESEMMESDRLNSVETEMEHKIGSSFSFMSSQM